MKMANIIFLLGIQFHLKEKKKKITTKTTFPCFFVIILVCVSILVEVPPSVTRNLYYTRPLNT